MHLKFGNHVTYTVADGSGISWFEHLSSLFHPLTHLLHSLSCCSSGVTLVLEVALCQLLNCWKCPSFQLSTMWVEALLVLVSSLSWRFSWTVSSCQKQRWALPSCQDWGALVFIAATQHDGTVLSNFDNQITESQYCLLAELFTVLYG